MRRTHQYDSIYNRILYYGTVSLTTIGLYARDLCVEYVWSILCNPNLACGLDVSREATRDCGRHAPGTAQIRNGQSKRDFCPRQFTQCRSANVVVPLYHIVGVVSRHFFRRVLGCRAALVRCIAGVCCCSVFLLSGR